MARNLAFQVLRGVKANLPVLEDGEFYFAKDTGELFVGLGGLNFKVGTGMAIVQIQDASGNNLTSTSGALDVNIKGDTDATPIPVSGTVSVGNFPATQPVSAATPLPTTQQGGVSGLVSDTQAKGVQGTIAIMVQDFKDAGRTPVILLVDQAAGIATEALATMTINKGGTVTSGTSYTVTAGKTLRITQFTLTVKASTTTAVDGRARLRSAATVAASSPIFAAAEASSPAAVANEAGTSNLAIPDGTEFAGGQQVGISHIESTATGTVSVIAIGFEY
jgi:hypothetical protein